MKSKSACDGEAKNHLLSCNMDTLQFRKKTSELVQVVATVRDRNLCIPQGAM